MNERTLRVLVVEDDPTQVQLLEEAFLEMEESRFRRPMYPCTERAYALDSQEAAELLLNQRYDAVLLDLAVLGESGLPAFIRLQQAGPEVPMVVLAPHREEALALGLIRQGAQEYLLHEEIDCAPLARALRCAIERNRLRQAALSLSLLDDLTGLYNRRGFLQVAERDCALARESGLKLRLSLMQWPADQDRDLLAVEMGERLRSRAPETAVVARIDERRMAVLAMGRRELDFTEIAPDGVTLDIVTSEVDADAEFDSMIAAAERALCENKLVENRAGRHL